MNRPWCCPDPRCAILYQLKDYDADALDEPQPGQSFVCFGKMPEGVRFNYDGVDHANDLRTCNYTPLKGLIVWQENEQDWVALIAAYQTALHAKGEEGESDEG